MVDLGGSGCLSMLSNMRRFIVIDWYGYGYT